MRVASVAVLVLAAQAVAGTAGSAPSLEGAWAPSGHTFGPTCEWQVVRRSARGTCALDATAGSAAGLYDVTGGAGRRTVHLSGARPDGVRLHVTARVMGDVGRLRFRVHGPHVHARGTATLARVGAANAGWTYDSMCGSCHGADARGTPGRPAIRCSARAVDTARTGLPGMQVFPPAEVPTDALSDVQAWLQTLCASDPPGVAAADLYASDCARCHGADAAGTSNVSGIQGPDLRCRSYQIIAAEISDGDAYMPSFPELTNAEVSAIGAFVRGRCPTTPPPY
jgi:mono/diheme cytochrome c family protein